MAGGTGLGGLESLQRLWGQISPTLQTLLAMDFKNLTLKDYVTIIGFVYTAGKSVYALYAMVKVVKIHGVSKVMRPNLKKKYGEWAGDVCQYQLYWLSGPSTRSLPLSVR